MSHTQILSVVTVVDSRHKLVSEFLQELHESVSSIGVPIEIVIVLNGYGSNTLQSIHAQSERLDNLQIYVLKTPVDYPTALIAGIENAIGDWIATLNLGIDDPSIVGKLFDAVIREGTEVALGISQKTSARRTHADALLSLLFHKVFRALHGYSLADEAPTARLLSRTIVNNLIQHDSPLVAIETLTATSDYRKSTVTFDKRAGTDLPISERVRIRWRTLISIDAVPLRLANLLCGLGAVSALLYSLYVVAVYLIKDTVVPGWTTVSLMLSGMFLMLSLVLWLMSEYMIMLLDSGTRRPRYEIAEEFASNIQSRQQHLNVEIEL